MEDTYNHTGVEAALKVLDMASYHRMVGPSTGLSKNIGNSYTAACYANLLCLISEKGAQLHDKRIGMFSYGSGAIATMWVPPRLSFP